MINRGYRELLQMMNATPYMGVKVEKPSSTADGLACLSGGLQALQQVHQQRTVTGVELMLTRNRYGNHCAA